MHFSDQFFAEFDFGFTGLALDANEQFPKVDDVVTVCPCGRDDDRIPLYFKLVSSCESCTY